MRKLLLVLGGALFLGACGDSGGTTDGGDGGGSTTAATTTSGAGGGPTCDDFANTAPIIQETEESAPAPEPQGGTVVDGTYFLTGDVGYTTTTPGPPDEQVRSTLVIEGTTWRRRHADGADVAAGNDSCVVWTVIASGLDIVAETDNGILDYTYTASGTTLSLYSGSRAETFERQ